MDAEKKVITAGHWMRNRETGDGVKITEVGPFMVKYCNDDVDGEVQLQKLDEIFEVIDDPSLRDDIEFLLRAKVSAGEAEATLYDMGTGFVAVNEVDGEVTFQWFDSAMPFSDVLLTD